MARTLKPRITVKAQIWLPNRIAIRPSLGISHRRIRNCDTLNACWGTPVFIAAKSGKAGGAWCRSRTGARVGRYCQSTCVSFARYSRDSSFAVVSRHRGFVLVMAAGAILGAWVGGRLLGIVPDKVLIPALAIILVIAAWKVWGHRRNAATRSAG